MRARREVYHALLLLSLSLSLPSSLSLCAMLLRRAVARGRRVAARPAARVAAAARRPFSTDEEAERIDAAKARRMEKAREVADAKAKEREIKEKAKAAAYQKKRDAYFRTKKHRKLREDVVVDGACRACGDVSCRAFVLANPSPPLSSHLVFAGARTHLPDDYIRRLMSDADKEIAVTKMPPLDLMPEIYGDKFDLTMNGGTMLELSEQEQSIENSIGQGYKPTGDQSVPEAFEKRQLRKYGFKLPHIVHIHSSWTKKKISTGSIMKRKQLLVAGDGRGVIGWGVGKSTDNYQAWMTAYSRCLENALFVPLSERRTIPHPVTGKFKRTLVRIMPAPRGHGLTAGRNVYPILETAGIVDAVTKVIGRRNPYNVVLAVFDGLRQLVSRQDMAEGRGKKVYDFLDPGDYHLVNPTEAEMDAQFEKASDAIDRAVELSARLRSQCRQDADAEAKEELASMDPSQLAEELRL